MRIERRLSLSLVALTLASCGGCKEKQPPVKVSAPVVQYQPDTLLGGELGVDHIGVAVRDLDAARRLYTEELGFGAPQPGRLPNGLENVNFYFADGSYIELLTFYDRQKAAWLASFLEKTEGAAFGLLSAYSAEETKAFLEKRGFTMGSIHSNRIDTPGQPAGTEPMWQTMFFDPSPLPGGRLGFISYDKKVREETLEKVARFRDVRRSPHPNTAKGMKAIWMVVKDLDAAKKAYESVGMPAGRSFEDPRLGAKGQEVIAGQGSILLLQPTDPKGPAASFLERRGESIAGLSIEVLSTIQAKAFIERKTQRPIQGYAGLFGQSILVPNDRAMDVWLEMFMQMPARR